MIPNHKNDVWLKRQITNGLTIPQIAQLCNVSEGTISDHLRKSDITIPGATKDNATLKWYGINRVRIPDEILKQHQITEQSTVAIFGATGFVGTNLTTYLKCNTSYKIVPLSRTNCDCMDMHAVKQTLNDIQPGIVVDLAAFVGGIGLNKENPADMIFRNLIMSANIVDACFTTGVRKLVYLGTVCSYPHTPQHVPFIADDLWYGRPESTNEPYGVAKKTIGLMLATYKKQFNFSSAYLIPTNMYGPWDDFSLHGSHVVPAMIRKFLVATLSDNTNTVEHWGNGKATRDFLFVDDCCEAIRLAIEKIDNPKPINIGSGHECSMRELSDYISTIIGYKGNVTWDTTKPNGQPRRCLDISVAQRLLQFTPMTDLNTGLKTTIDWYCGTTK